jgi:two-component system phosphate regulon sensor histidine kinase PhoR
MLTRRYIPWLEGWSIAVVEQDISSLEQASDNIRRQKLLVIGMSIFLMVIGGYLSVRVTINELNTATIKSNFAASISHELRSPITQIRLKGEALLFDLVEEEELQEHYESIVRESERLSWLVDNVLDYAALERDNRTFLFREGDLNKVITRVVESISSTLTMREVHIELHLDPNLPKLRFDSNGVSQCLINLLNNAEKYSKEEKWISVGTRREVEGIEVWVSDRGIGITKEDAQDIFAPFFRSKEKEAIRRKGTGIGLSIVQTIILAHGGKVLVQSQLGKGSNFILQFPNELIVEGEENV